MPWESSFSASYLYLVWRRQIEVQSYCWNNTVCTCESLVVVIRFKLAFFANEGVVLVGALLFEEKFPVCGKF